MSLNEAMKNASEGGYVNGEFEANVSFPETKEYQGRNFYVAKLTDGPTTVRVAGGIDFAPFDGKRVKVNSPYKKAKAYVKWKETYNGTPKLSIGEGVEVTGTTAHTDAPQQAPSAAPAQSGGTAIPGVTVGMALNKAVDIAISTGDVSNGNIYRTASALVKIAEKMQAGVLSFDDAPEVTSTVTDGATTVTPTAPDADDDDLPF